jgi:uncharacterized membrane protein YcjF (UPF0283 family)
VYGVAAAAAAAAAAAVVVAVILLVFVVVTETRRMIRARYLARPEEMRSVYHVSVGKLEKKRQLGRFRIKGEYNIKIDLYEVGCHHST